MEWALVLGLALSPAGPALALQSTVSVQYSRFEQPVLRLNADGTYREGTRTTEAWLQSMNVRGGAQLRPNLALAADIRWSDQYTIGGNYRTQTPYGRLQLAHPMFGVTAMYQPERTTSTFGGYGDNRFVPITLDTRSDRLSLTGFFARQGLPRVSAQWDRRHQGANPLYTESSRVSRQLGATHNLGRVSLSGAYRDQARSATGGSLMPPDQKSWDFQAGSNAIPRPNLSLGFGYGYGGSRTSLNTASPGRYATHTASVSGSYQQASNLGWSLGYGFRHADSGPRGLSRTNDHNGTLSLGYQPIPIASFSASGALSSSGSTRFASVSKSLGMVGSIGAPVRHGWRAGATASRSLVWQAQVRGAKQDALGADTQLDLGHHMLLNGSWQMSASGDASSGPNRVGMQTTTAFSGRPTSSVNFSATEQRSRTGRAWNRTSSGSRSRTFSAGVRPSRRLDLSAAFSQTVTTPNASISFTSQQYGANWHPGQALQISAQYAKSAAVDPRERSQGHLNTFASSTATPIANLHLSASFGISNVGEQRETRNFSAVATRVFGR